ncbi:MAG: hypothetical protein ABH830_02435 [Patescibacteria group bacterium]
MIGKKEIVVFLKKTFKEKKYPGTFRLDILFEGDRQFEEFSEPCVKELKKFLAKSGFSVIMNLRDKVNERDIYLYTGWGSFTYAHIRLFSKKTIKDFTQALVEFYKEKNKLEIKQKGRTNRTTIILEDLQIGNDKNIIIIIRRK